MSYILLVEDDLEIAENVILFLKASRFETRHLASGEHVVSTVKDFEPDLILLDLMLPVMDGIECCKQIREFSDVPVVMMTAKVEEIDRCIGLEAGADDYVCKPFSAAELMLRIKAIIRRTNRSKKASDFNFNQETLKLNCRDLCVELTHLESKLFSLLFNKPSRVYSREQILDLAYPDIRDISDRTIDAHVKNLRKKIKTLNIGCEVVESVYGVGYRYVEPVNKQME